MKTHSELLEQIILIELTFKNLDYAIPPEISEAHVIRLGYEKRLKEVTPIDPLQFEGVGSIKTKYCCHVWSRRIHLTTDFATTMGSLQGYFGTRATPPDRSRPI